MTLSDFSQITRKHNLQKNDPGLLRVERGPRTPRIGHWHQQPVALSSPRLKEHALPDFPPSLRSVRNSVRKSVSVGFEARFGGHGVPRAKPSVRSLRYRGASDPLLVEALRLAT